MALVSITEIWLTQDFCYAITPGTFADLVDHLVPELQRRGVHWLDYPKERTTAREALYEVGQTGLRRDHYGSRFHWAAGQEAPKLA
jgi:hypothetical protein